MEIERKNDRMASQAQDIVDYLEDGEYCEYPVGSYVQETKEKLIEFNNFFNSYGRLALSQASKNEAEEFVSLLFTLKKSIKIALTEIGRAHHKLVYKLSCSKCNEIIELDRSKNIWENLQDHEHFEDLYYNYLNAGKILSVPSYDDRKNDNTDSGIEHADYENFEHLSSYIPIPRPVSPTDDRVNSFRFNFEVRYDEEIEKKLYPENWVRTVRKLDNCENYTIQKAGHFRSVCLLCGRELMSRSRISKIFIQDHVIGQRHLKCSTIPMHVELLKKYHDTWLNIEMPYQAHQVYFITEPPTYLKCVLCRTSIECNYKQIIKHIKKENHEKKVMHLLQENSNNIYYLLHATVKVYGVDEKLLQKEEKKEPPPNPEIDVPRNSDSSPTEGTQEEGKLLTTEESTDSGHNIIKSVFDSTGNNILDLVPNRFKNHLIHLKEKNNMIGCLTCNVSLAKDVITIKKHIRQTNHIKLSALPIPKYDYYCEICNMKFSNENDWEKHFTPGQHSHKNIARSRRARVTEYECKTCSLVLYGDELSVSRHISSSRRKRAKQVSDCNISYKVDDMFVSVEAIETKGEEMTKEALDVLNHNQRMTDCCTRLEIQLKTIFENCKAHPFGSRVSGLGHKESDLDIFIDVDGNMYMGEHNQDSISQVQFVRKAANILCKHKDEFSDVVAIATARTPIVKVVHMPTNIECDLSFKHGLSVENTKFLRFCIDIQPITQPFILILKKWFESNNFKENMSNYALSIMAIFYLQVEGYLLSVKEIREINRGSPVMINGWETINYKLPVNEMKKYIRSHPPTLVKLLSGFFKYFSEFNYAQNVVCPLLGEVIRKDLFKGPPEHLVPDMASYVAQLKGKDPEEFRASSAFCVQDPFDLSHNLTKAWPSATAKNFKGISDVTYKHLDQL